MQPIDQSDFVEACASIRAMTHQELVLRMDLVIVIFQYLRWLPPTKRPLSEVAAPEHLVWTILTPMLAKYDSIPTPSIVENGSNDTGSLPIGHRCQASVGEIVRPTNEFLTSGGFKLTRHLGRGALGDVYEANMVHLRDKPVAIKLLQRGPLTSGSIGVLTAFSEAQAGFGLSHPNLIRVNSCGDSATHGQYVAMEFVPGKTLDEWLRIDCRGKGMGERRAVEVVALIASAVAAVYASEKKLVHRDIKPSNIVGAMPMESTPNQLDVAKLKLGDYGLAQHASGEDQSPLNVNAPVYGTPAYMAPEQITLDAKARVSGAADVFALGMTLLEIVIGLNPVKDATAKIELALKTENITAAQVQAIRQDYEILFKNDAVLKIIENLDLRAVIAKCIAVNPSDRYQDASLLEKDLRRWLAGYPVKARPYTIAQKVRLLILRARRSGDDYEDEQATVWSVGLILIAMICLFAHASAIIKIIHGESDEAALAIPTIQIGLPMLAICLTLRLCFPLGRWVRQMSSYLITNLVGFIILVHYIINDFAPYNPNISYPSACLLSGVFAICMGLGRGPWRLVWWVGWVSVILVVPLSMFSKRYGGGQLFGLIQMAIQFQIFFFAIYTSFLRPKILKATLDGIAVKSLDDKRPKGTTRHRLLQSIQYRAE
jgi:hypothetical protein